MTDAAKVAALREALMAALRDELWEDQSEGDPDVEAATADRILARPDVRAALSASDSGEVAGLRAALERINRGCQVIHGNYPPGTTCLDVQRIAHEHPENYLEPYRMGDFLCDGCIVRAALTRPVSETREAAPSSETRR